MVAAEHNGRSLYYFTQRTSSRGFMSSPVPRYLVPFHPKRVSHHFVDVLVIGGGIAGLRATMALDPRLTALVVTKDQLQESNSQYAQGGIASVLGTDDRFEHHVEDTLAAGA